MFKEFSSNWIFADLLGELLGSFTYITFVLVQTSYNKNLRLSNDKVFGTLIIVIGFIIGRTFTFHSGGVMNPGTKL